MLAEVATGAPTDAAIWHVLAQDLDAGPARGCSHARRRTAYPYREGATQRRDLAVDAIVAATAVGLAPSVVLTGDKSDLELLVEGFDVGVSAI